MSVIVTAEFAKAIWVQLLVQAVSALLLVPTLHPDMDVEVAFQVPIIDGGAGSLLLEQSENDNRQRIINAEYTFEYFIEIGFW